MAAVATHIAAQRCGLRLTARKGLATGPEIERVVACVDSARGKYAVAGQIRQILAFECPS